MTKLEFPLKQDDKVGVLTILKTAHCLFTQCQVESTIRVLAVSGLCHLHMFLFNFRLHLSVMSGLHNYVSASFWGYFLFFVFFGRVLCLCLYMSLLTFTCRFFLLNL